jgi:HK97 family phage portal protein
VSQFDWVVQCVASLLLDGNAYGLITSRRFGWPSSIEWLDPRTVEVNRAGFRVTYKVDGVDVPAEDVVHVRNVVLPGAVKGISVVQQNADVIRLGLEAQKFALDFFVGGGHPTGVIESDHKFEKGDGEAVSARFVDRSKKRGPVALGSGFKYRTIQATPDLTTVEMSRMVAADIARCFGLQPENIGASGGSSMTYANVEQKTSDMVTFGLRPVFTRIERALTAQHPRPQFVRFNADAMVRTDLLTRYQAHEIGIRSRFLTQSEARDLEDLPFIAGTDQLAPLMPEPAPVKRSIPAVWS